MDRKKGGWNGWRKRGRGLPQSCREWSECVVCLNGAAKKGYI